MLAAVQEQLEGGADAVSIDGIAEEIFQRAACRSSVEKLLCCVNDIATHAERLAAVAAAPRLLLRPRLR